MTKIRSTLTVAAIVLLSNCSGDKDEALNPGGPQNPGNNAPCTNVAAAYAANVAPIIQTKCAIGSECHGAGSTNGVGPLLTYDHAKSAAASIKAAVVAKTMPKTGSLTEAQISAILCWVDSGAPNN